MEQSSNQRIVAKLNELSEVKAATDLTRLDYESKRAEILKSIQAELDALDAEFNPLLESSSARIAKLESEIKDAVLHHGASVKGSHLYAVYYQGRVSWDTQGLDSYATSHPEVAGFRKQSEPSVNLRTVK